MVSEVLELARDQEGLFIDGTFGEGGHSFQLLQQLAHNINELIALDQDPHILEIGRARLENFQLKNIHYYYSNFINIPKILTTEHNHKKAAFVLMDLGVSSYHFSSRNRGFSYEDADELDMKLNPEIEIGAQHIINNWDAKSLTQLFYSLGEERWSKKIAQYILQQRQVEKITTAQQLSSIVKKSIPARYWGKIHPATRVFQALRIFVNKELQVLEKTIPDICSNLDVGGILAILSFHSLEDRIVKHKFREIATNNSFKVITKKPICTSEAEIINNRKSRSAKLRAIQKN